jgi:hypothetical protein
MRCQKCSFISFDHLAECKKCGVSLVAVRDAMGFYDFKPSIPFVLGPLLKNQESRGLDMEGTTETGSPMFPEDLQLDEMGEASLDFDTMDEELTIELTDDELTNLMDDTGAEQKPQATVSPEAIEDTVTAPLDDLDEDEIQIGDDFEIELKDEEPTQQTVTMSAGEKTKAERTTMVADESEEDELVLDLEQNDLESFLKELDGKTPEKK